MSAAVRASNSCEGLRTRAHKLRSPGSCLWDGRYGDMKWEFPGARNNAQGSPQEASEPLGASMAKRPSLAARAPRAWESPPHAVDAS